MVAEASLQRLATVLDGATVDCAYYLHPLPRGLVTAARGGLAVLFGATTNPSQRYDLSQRIRFQLMGVLPAGHTEVIALNDARLALAGAALASGVLVYDRDPAHRLRYETTILSEMLDFTMTAERFLGAAASV